MDINSFKKDVLITYKDNLIDVVRKNLINGSSYFFDHKKIIDDEYLIKKDLSDALNIHSNDILIVGSGKLGFSIKPEKDGKYMFNSFRFEATEGKEESDIDIAIIDSNLFEDKLKNLYEHMIGYDDIKINEFFNDCSKKRKKPCFYGFSRYILMGWLRPDQMPIGFNLFKDIEKIQNKYRKKYNIKINIGIYKSWFYFENYNIQNLKNMQNTLMLEGVKSE